MSNKFKEQGGAATMDPSKLRRWITSRLFTKVTSQKYQTAKQSKAEQDVIMNENNSAPKIDLKNENKTPGTFFANTSYQWLCDTRKLHIKVGRS